MVVTISLKDALMVGIALIQCVCSGVLIQESKDYEKNVNENSTI